MQGLQKKLISLLKNWEDIQLTRNYIPNLGEQKWNNS